MQLHASRLLRLLPRVGEIARFSTPLEDGRRLAPAAYRVLHIIAPRGSDERGEVAVSLVDPCDEEAEGPILSMTLAGAVAALHRGPTADEWAAAACAYSAGEPQDTALEQRPSAGTSHDDVSALAGSEWYEVSFASDEMTAWTP